MPPRRTVRTRAARRRDASLTNASSAPGSSADLPTAKERADPDTSQSNPNRLPKRAGRKRRAENEGTADLSQGAGERRIRQKRQFTSNTTSNSTVSRQRRASEDDEDYHPGSDDTSNDSTIEESTAAARRKRSSRFGTQRNRVPVRRNAKRNPVRTRAARKTNISNTQGEEGEEEIMASSQPANNNSRELESVQAEISPELNVPDTAETEIVPNTLNPTSSAELASDAIIPTNPPTLGRDEKALNAILAVARGEKLFYTNKLQNELKKSEATDAKEKGIPKVSMAVFAHCAFMRSVDLFTYLSELCTLHERMIQTYGPRDDVDEITADVSVEQLDKMKMRPSADEWSARISNDLSNEEIIPLPMECTLDFLDLMLLVQRFTLSERNDGLCHLTTCWTDRGMQRHAASLAISIFGLWLRCKKGGKERKNKQKRCLLLEKALQLLSRVLVQELNVMGEDLSKKVKPENLAKGEDLSKTVKPENLATAALAAASSQGYLTTLLGELYTYFESVQIADTHSSNSLHIVVLLLVIRTVKPFGDESVHFTHWNRVRQEEKNLVKEMAATTAFWQTTVQISVQELETTKYEVGYSQTHFSFLVSILRDQDALPAIQEDPGIRHAFLRVARSFLEEFADRARKKIAKMGKERKVYPDAYDGIDFMHAMGNVPALQKDLFVPGGAGFESTLQLVKGVVIETENAAPYSMENEDTIVIATSGKFCPSKWAHSFKSSLSNMKKTNVPFYRRAAHFSKWVLESMLKKSENEALDSGEEPALRLLMHRISETPEIMKFFWNSVITIQYFLCTSATGRKNKKTDGGGPSTASFEKIIEIVRRAVCDNPKLVPAEGAASETSSSPNSSSSNSSEFEPDVDEKQQEQMLKELTEENAQLPKKRNLSVDSRIVKLRGLARSMRENGRQMIARFDKNSNIPVKWVTLKRNVYIGDARKLLPAECKERLVCNCKPAKNKKYACATSECINVATKMECGPGPCGAGKTCANRKLENGVRPKLVQRYLGSRGFGLLAGEDIPEGSLVGEYTGEVVDNASFKVRERKYFGERHFYAMQLTNKLMIDATRKSGVMRLLNHSCDPNMDEQKWTAGGELRMVFFAKHDIKQGEEITIDYNMTESNALQNVDCKCGTKICRGSLLSGKKEPSAWDRKKSESKNLKIQKRQEKMIGKGKGLLRRAESLDEKIAALGVSPPVGGETDQ